MQCRLNLLAVLAAGTGLALLGTSPLRAGAWRQLEAIPTEDPHGVYDFVVDTSGTPWAAAGDLVWWWDGRKWHQATDGKTPYASGQCTGRLYGDSQRGAYLSQKVQDQCEGTLFRLRAGRAHPVGTFRVDLYHVSPGIYVSRAGEVFNFGERFLAVLKDGRWEPVETRMASTREQVRIVDLGPEGPVLFMPQSTSKAAIYDGKTFHTGVPLPEFKIDSPANIRMTHWGKERVLFWRVKSRLLGAAKVAGNRFEPVDTAALEDQLGDPEWIYGVASAPDGSLWARVGQRNWSDPNLVRIAPDGKVTRHRARSIMWGIDPDYYYEHSALHARDGTFWFGILKGGIDSVRDGKAHAHDWRDGMLAADVLYLAEAPDGTVYAASANPGHHVYCWDPEATPDRSLTEHWDSIEYRISRKLIADFEGNPWMFRLDRPGKVSLWDGTEWRDFDAPFDPDRLRYAVADDQGHLTVVELLPPRRSYVLGPDGVQKYEDLREALVARVHAGARRFRTPDKDLVPPVVSRDGRIWLAHSPYYRKRDLFAYFDGKWQPMELKGVNAMGVDETGRPVFITGDAVWTYRGGRIEKLADVDASKRSKFKVLGQYDRDGNVPFVDDPPEFIRRQFTLYAGLGGHRYYPMPWRALREGAEEFPEPILLDTGRPVRITYPRGAIPAPGGGAWLKETFSPPWRWLDDLVFRVNPLQTPLAHQWWVDAGVTGKGGVWVVAGDSHGGRRIFFRRPKPKEQIPTVGLRKSEVRYGRHLLLAWDLPAKGVAAAVWRAGPDDYWHVLDECTFQCSFTEPGKHVLRLEAMALDELGVPGPATVRAVEVDVRLPRTRWTEEPPECLDDLVWIVPVDADWTHPEVPRRIEWRVADGDWQPLPEDRRLPVARYNNQAVDFQFRAVEEGRFADPKPLVLKVAVEMPLEEVIGRRIKLILSGTEAERKRAVEDLKAAPKEAARLLREKLDELQAAEQRCREALTELETAKRLEACDYYYPPAVLGGVTQLIEVAAALDARERSPADSVDAQVEQVAEEIRAYCQAVRAGQQVERDPWLKRRKALIPLVPHLLASADADVRREALRIMRLHYPEETRDLIPQVIKLLDTTLKDPRDEEGTTRRLACEILGKRGEFRAVPVLLKALADPYQRHDLYVAPDGIGEHVYFTVWWDADEALRKITGANPVARPMRRLPPNPGKQKACEAAWNEWWKAHRDHPRSACAESASGGPLVEFTQRGPMTMAQATADLSMAELGPSISKVDSGRSIILKLQWTRTIRCDERRRPALLVTLHRYSPDRFSRDEPDPQPAVTDLLRIYAVDGEQLLPRHELRTVTHIEPVQLFREGEHEFLLVPMGSLSVTGRRRYHVFWLDGARVKEVPLEDPSEKAWKLVGKGEQPAYSGWNVSVEETPVALGACVWVRGDPACRPTGGRIIGTLKLVEDAQGRPSRFVIDQLKRIRSRRPTKPPSTDPEPDRATRQESIHPERRFREALEGEGEGAALTPDQVVALLEKTYHPGMGTREWEMLGGGGYWSWTHTARRVAEKFPEAVHRAAVQQTEFGNELLFVLGDVGGKENIAFLARLCEEEPCWYSVLALGRTKSPDAWPALRSVMNRRLITATDLSLAWQAAEALARAGDPQIVDTLKQWAASGSRHKQRMAMGAAALLGAAELVPALAAADPRIVGEDRELLYRAMVACGDERYLEKVHRLALDEREYLWEAKLESPDPAIVMPIHNYTQNQALDSVAKLGSRRSLPVLDKLAAEAVDPRIRKRAAEIAQRIRTAAQQSEPAPGQKEGSEAESSAEPGVDGNERAERLKRDRLVPKPRRGLR